MVKRAGREHDEWVIGQYNRNRPIEQHISSIAEYNRVMLAKEVEQLKEQGDPLESYYSEVISDTCEGKCPNCRSENLEYDDSYTEDYVSYHFTCLDCKTEGVEYYALQYDYTNAKIISHEKRN